MVEYVKSECVKFEYEKFEDVVLFESKKIEYVSLNIKFEFEKFDFEILEFEKLESEKFEYLKLEILKPAKI